MIAKLTNSIGGFMNQEVTDYINKLTAKPKQEWQAEVCNQLRQVVFQAIPEVDERLQYGKPHYRKNGKYACVLSTAKGWVTFTIFEAEALQAPEGFFEPGDPNRKTIKILEGQAVDYALVGKLIQQAGTSA
jgi:hypothetical protein